MADRLNIQLLLMEYTVLRILLKEEQSSSLPDSAGHYVIYFISVINHFYNTLILGKMYIHYANIFIYNMAFI